MNARELRLLFKLSGLLHKDKLRYLDLDLAIENIIGSNSYEYFNSRDEQGRLVAHVGLIMDQVNNGLITNHCSTMRGRGREVIINLGKYLYKHRNIINTVECYYDPSKPTGHIYKFVTDAVNDPTQCSIVNGSILLLGEPNHNEDYGLSLSHYNSMRSVFFPSYSSPKVYSRFTIHQPSKAVPKLMEALTGRS